MLIWLDAQHLPWSEEERAALAEDEDARWLLQEFPAGVHGRPDGSGSAPPAHPLQLRQRPGRRRSSRCPSEPHYAEIALRGMSTMVPALQAYVGKRHAAVRRRRLLHQDAREPAADRSAAGRGRLRVGRLLGVRRDGLVRRRGADRPAHHRRDAARLCAGLPAVALSGPAYCALLDRWGDGGQLLIRLSSAGMRPRLRSARMGRTMRWKRSASSSCR